MSGYTIELINKKGNKVYPKEIDLVCGVVGIVEITDNIDNAVVWEDDVAAQILADEYPNSKVVELNK